MKNKMSFRDAANLVDSLQVGDWMYDMYGFLVLIEEVTENAPILGKLYRFTSRKAKRRVFVSGKTLIRRFEKYGPIDDDPEIYTKPVADMVNSPSHYMNSSVECIEAIKASMTPEAFKGYLKGNVMKYMWRYEKKINPAEDLKKARWYQDRLIKVLSDA